MAATQETERDRPNWPHWIRQWPRVAAACCVAVMPATASRPRMDAATTASKPETDGADRGVVAMTEPVYMMVDAYLKADTTVRRGLELGLIQLMVAP